MSLHFHAVTVNIGEGKRAFVAILVAVVVTGSAGTSAGSRGRYGNGTINAGKGAGAPSNGMWESAAQRRTQGGVVERGAKQDGSRSEP